MRILMIGAGVLGSNLAHSMQKGNDITILARGKTCQNLKSDGFLCLDVQIYVFQFLERV